MAGSPASTTCRIPSSRTIRSSASIDFLGVLLVRVLHAPLIPRLRPAADLHPLHLLALHLRVRDLLPEPEDEDARRVRVRDQRGIPRVFVVEARQVVEVRLVVDVEPVLVHRRAELHGLEEIVRAGAGEQRQAVGRWLELLLQILA